MAQVLMLAASVLEVPSLNLGHETDFVLLKAVLQENGRTVCPVMSLPASSASMTVSFGGQRMLTTPSHEKRRYLVLGKVFNFFYLKY